MTKLRQVDEVSPNHVGEVGNARRKDGFDSKATDFFLKISSGFDPKPWQLYIHHFVLKADKNSNTSSIISQTRSLGARWAPTSSWRPFGPA